MSDKETVLDEGLENQPKPHQKEEDKLDTLAVPSENNPPEITGKSGAKRPADKDNAEAPIKMDAPKVESVEIDDSEEAKLVSEQKEVSVELSEDIKSILESIDLPEEFKEKALTLFEAAVAGRVADIKKELTEANEVAMTAYKDALATRLEEQVSTKIAEATAQWIAENEVAVKASVRTQIAESFMAGLHDLFESHYITVPEGKEDILESTAAKLAETEAKLEESVKQLDNLIKESTEMKKKLVVEGLSKNLTDTQAERLMEMVSSVEFESQEQYEAKVSTIVESLVAVKPSELLVEDGDGEVITENKEDKKEETLDADPAIVELAAAISKMNGYSY